MPELTQEQYQARQYHQQIINEINRRKVQISPKMTEVSKKLDSINSELLKRGIDPETNEQYIREYVISETKKFERFKEELPEMVGGAAYGLVGGSAFGPIGGIVGAGIGGMTGKAYQQVYKGLKEPEKAPTVTEMAKELSMAGGRQAAYEVGGRTVMGGLSKAIRPVFRKIAPEIKSFAVKGQEKMMQYGSHMTPAQMTESGLLDTIEEITEKGFFSRGTMHKFKALRQPQALKEWSEDVANSFAADISESLSHEEVGIVFRDVFAGENETFKAVGKTMYGEVDKLMKGATVDLREVKKFAQSVFNVAKERKGIGDTAAGMGLIKKVLKLKDAVTFEEAQSIRSGLGDEIYSMSVNRDKAQGLSKKLYALMDKRMTVASKNLGGEAYDVWKKADAFWKTSKESFSNEILRRLAIIGQKNPEFVSKAIFQNKAVTKIKAVKRLLRGNPDIWQNMKTTWISDLFEKGSDVDGVIIGKSFQKKLNQMGDEALKEILTPIEKTDLNLLINTARMVQERTGGSGGMLIQLTQSGPIIGLATGAIFSSPTLAMMGGALLVTPTIMAKTITNPKLTNWIIQGMKMPNTAPAATNLFIRIAGAIKKIEADTEQEK